MTTNADNATPSVRRERLQVADLAPGQVARLRTMVAAAETEVAAAAALGQLADHGTRAAVNAVRDALDDPRTGVRAEAARLLGRVGSPEDYRRLARLRPRSLRHRRKIRFGATLLAHRHGLDRAARARLDDVVVVPADALDLSPIEVSEDGADLVSGVDESIPADEVATEPAVMLRHSFGVDVAASGPVLHCGTDPTMVLAADVIRSGPVEALVRRPNVLAVGVSPGQEVDRWSSDWVALSTPLSDGVVALRVHSSSGRLQFAGTGTVEGTELVFALGPVQDATGPQLVMSGVVGEQGLRITSASRGSRSRPGRRPTPDD